MRGESDLRLGHLRTPGQLEFANASESTLPSHIETTVENRNLHADGTDALIVDGIEQPVQQGWSAELDGARWAHLEGVGGYVFPVFPGGATLSALHEETHRQLARNHPNGSEDPVTRW